MSRIAALFRFGRTHGWGSAGYRLLTAGLKTVRLTWLLHVFAAQVARARRDELRAIRRLPGAYRVEPASAADAAALGAFSGKAERCTQRLGAGELCLVLRAGGEIRAAEWLARGPSEFVEDRPSLACIWRVPAGACWLYDGLGTRVGAWGSLMMVLPRFLAEWGVDQAFSQIECGNVEARVSHETLGYRMVGRIVHVRILGLSFRLWRGERGGWRRLPARFDGLEAVK